jgi:hypothetical protein
VDEMDLYEFYVEAESPIIHMRLCRNEERQVFWGAVDVENGDSFVDDWEKTQIVRQIRVNVDSYAFNFVDNLWGL